MDKEEREEKEEKMEEEEEEEEEKEKGGKEEKSKEQERPIIRPSLPWKDSVYLGPSSSASVRETRPS